MYLEYKHPHNVLPFLEKHVNYPEFHPIIDFLKRFPLSYALTINPTLYDSRIREFWETVAYAFQDKKHTITTKVDGKPLVIRIETIQTHLQVDDTKGKYSFPDADVEQTFRDMGYGGNPKVTIKKN
ncbi:hypothetical protein L1987_06709 [Smallanthus sonchifolius]|uniref:Uncharacterized protein n=1 Tax=Smallanthus sonchifolius TaxID=185202 RepID=A0ACB9JYW9_9ASTR|nr:hypothetical protein L1987_06709 [Smallanthus sonchifolius]